MESYALSTGLKGVANWFNVQVKEELDHARKLYDYVIEQGSRVMLKAVDNPPQDFTSAEDLFEKTLAHEQKVTGLINGLVNTAKEEKDELTEEFLQWFVKEQVEEEASSGGALKKVKDAGASGLAEVDAKLAKRV